MGQLPRALQNATRTPERPSRSQIAEWRGDQELRESPLQAGLQARMCPRRELGAAIALRPRWRRYNRSPSALLGGAKAPRASSILPQTLLRLVQDL